MKTGSVVAVYAACMLLFIGPLSFKAFPAEDTAFAEPAPGLRISLLTCSEGMDPASAFGHSAIRVVDSLCGTDLVFNYGTYDFYEEGFLLKFLRGKLEYFLSVGDYRRFVASYERDGRGVSEQVLKLDGSQTERIYGALVENARPENRYYLYDFLIDNCATRIRDIFHTPDFSRTVAEEDFTYRDELERCVGGRPWLMFGIDLLLGQRVDRRITSEEAMFLPDRLSVNLQDYINVKTGMPLLGSRDSIVLPGNAGSFGEVMQRIFQPVAVFALLCVLYVLCFLKVSDKALFVKIFSTVFYLLAGIGGLILVFMWFGTEHIWTKANWNLMWMNPLFLILPFMRPGKIRRAVAFVLTGAACCAILCSWFIPQSFNPAVSLIVLLELLIPVSMATISYK